VIKVPLYIDAQMIDRFSAWTAVEGIRIVTNEGGLPEIPLTTALASARERDEGSPVA